MSRVVAGLVGAAAWLVLAVCGGPAAATAVEVPFDFGAEANRFIDWDQEDWKFIYPGTPLGYGTARHNSFGDYQDLMRYQGSLARLDLDAYQALPAADRQERRERAAEHLAQAMGFYREMLRSWEIWCLSLRSQVASSVWMYANGVISQTIGNLESAAGLDPSNPFTWRHLAFFTGLVGNAERQREALDAGLATARDFELNNPDMPSGSRIELHLARLRMLLDRAWCRREDGLYAAAARDVDLAVSLIAGDELKTLDTGREAMLLRALLLVDQNRLDEARAVANRFERWRLPGESAGGPSPPMMKQNLPHFDSDFCRRWVLSMVYMKLDLPDQALGWCGRRTRTAEYPAHLGYRLWQDMGQVADHFLDRKSAAIFYRLAVRTRPYISFFPMRGMGGFSSLFGMEDIGSPFYMGYWEFFVGGSYFSYAAHWTVLTEQMNTPAAKARVGKQALAALDHCRRRGIRPVETLALQGFVHYQLGRFELAAAELQEADREFTAAGLVNGEVVRLLAVLQFEVQNFTAGEVQLVRYLDLHPDDASGWQLLGLARARQDKFEAALVCMDEALVRDPDSVAAWYNRAVIGLHLGRIDRAREDLARAAALAPQNAEVARLVTMISGDLSGPVAVTINVLDLPASRPTSVRTRPEDAAIRLDSADLDNLLSALRAAHAADPNPANRLALARVLDQSGATTELQDLLAPVWPDRISQEGVWLLLKADRSQGRPQRAIELAQTLDSGGEAVADAELWALVAVTCLESGADAPGDLALVWARELDPDNEALATMQRNRP